MEEIADRPKRTERKIKNAGCPEIIESESSFAISTVNFAVSMTKSTFQIITDTVDGSEIPLSPLEVGSCSHYLLRFFIPGGCLVGFLNHQQQQENQEVCQSRESFATYKTGSPKTSMTVGSTKIHEIQLFHKIPIELKWICPFDFALQILCLEDGSWSSKLGVFLL